MSEADPGLRSFLMLIPLLGAGASMTVMMLFRGSSLAAVGALMMVVTVIASVVMVFSQRGRASRDRQQQRDRYLAYLERERAVFARDEQDYAQARRRADPEPKALLDLTRSSTRLWERRREDPDFLSLRLGTGSVPFRSIRAGDDQNAMAVQDEFMVFERGLVAERFGTSADLPVTVELAGRGDVSVVGDRDFVLHVARLLLSQATTLSSPEDLELALAAGPDRIDDWRWAGWLPHLADQSQITPQGPARRVAPDPAGLNQLLRSAFNARASAAAEQRRNFLANDSAVRFARLMVVLDVHGERSRPFGSADRETASGDLGVTVLHLVQDRADEPEDVGVRLSQSEPGGNMCRIEEYERRDLAPRVRVVRMDDFGVREAEALARQLAGLRLSPDSLEHDAGRQAVETTALMGLDDLERIDLDRAWAPRPRTSFLRVPIGTDDEGRPVMLDLKEAAHFGMGPHGLCVGATGSGKSELLRTLVLGLLTSHGPDDISMVLVDYKGGATFAPFATAPQVSGIITNLSDDANLVERVYASLSGEVQRRQQVLKDHGNLADVSAYRRARRERAGSSDPLPPLPHLLVIIDEFGELLTARPDFIELFLSIGRIGRSIGVHLLLSSQRIEGGRLRGLDTYLSYRIGLRTLSEGESRTVLETVDAFSLPPLPGYGYLKVDTTTYVRFRAGFVSGPLPRTEEQGAAESVPVVRPLSTYAFAEDTGPDGVARGRRGAGGAGVVGSPRPGGVSHLGSSAPGATDGEEEEASGPTVLSTVIDQLSLRPRTAASVWLPPLPDVLTLDQCCGRPHQTAGGLRVRRSHRLRVPIGLLDDPAKQWQDVWELDLARAGGNVLIIGAPQTGRTTVLQTLAAALSLTHTPEEVVVYGVDLLAANLSSLTNLPVVGGVALRTEREVVRRTIEEVSELIADRERLLQQAGADSLSTARQLALDGDPALAGSMLADVVLMIDGFGQITEEFEELEETVRAIVRRGGGFGIHVVATVSRWNEVRLNQQTFFGNRIELRLGDPGESAVKRKLSETLTDDRPGRCLLANELFAQVALPRMDGRADRASVREGLGDLIRRVGASATGSAPPIRLLPAVVRAELLDPVDGRRSAEPGAAGSDPVRPPGLIPLGMAETDLSTVWLDTEGADRNVMILGDPGTGRSSVLRQFVAVLTEQYSSEDLVFAVFDPRRTLHGVVPEPYLGGYATSAALAERLVAAVVPQLEKRVPSSPDEEVEPPRPRIVMLVDDYDVLTAGGRMPLQRMLPFVAMAREVGLSIVINRRISGAARGVYEPFLMSLSDSSSTALMFSGDRSEGQLIGSVRPRRLPVGRAQLLRTGDAPVVVQTAWREPSGRLEGSGFVR